MRESAAPLTAPTASSRAAREAGAALPPAPAPLSSREAPAPITESPRLVPKAPALRVNPAVLTLVPGDPGAQLVAEREGTHGGLLDLTAKVDWSAEPAGVVAIEAGGYVRAISAGKATIRAVQADDRAEVAVTVCGDEAKHAWSFAEDVVPIFTRSGCNTGGCHGKAEGQNGFHLSLFGYDPAGDYLTLTRAAGGRRLDRLAPEQSLMLLKALGRTPHGGGPRIKTGRPSIGPCSPGSRPAPPSVSAQRTGRCALAVEPGDHRLDEPGPRQLRVVAVCRRPHARRHPAGELPRQRRLGRLDRSPRPRRLAPPGRGRPGRALPVAGRQHPARHADQSRPRVRLQGAAAAELHRPGALPPPRISQGAAEPDGRRRRVPPAGDARPHRPATRHRRDSQIPRRHRPGEARPAGRA